MGKRIVGFKKKKRKEKKKELEVLVFIKEDLMCNTLKKRGGGA